MKKSKVLIPAMALLLFSTAASITGTVAWFTANRTYTMTAGNFAVVNTKDTLECVLSAGIGTHVSDNSVTVGPDTNDITADDWTTANHDSKVGALTSSHVGNIYKENGTNYWVCTGEGLAVDMGTSLPAYKLTDASFDHTSTGHELIVPNADGDKVAYNPDITAATKNTAGIFREANTTVGAIFSAFTWDMEFKLAFGAAPSAAHVGLYLDTADSATWMKLSDADSAPADTGKAFKVAFVPIAASGMDGIGVTKVWGDVQTRAKTEFVDGLAVNASLAGTAYTGETTTVQYNGSAYSPSAVTSAQALSASDAADTLTVPENRTHSTTTCLTATNCLGYFTATAGETVSLKFKCVAFYEGTDENIETASSTVYETMRLSMKFGVSNLSN